MKTRHYPIYEYGLIPRAEIVPLVLRKWQRFDEQHALQSGDTVFDWNHLHSVRAKNYVGVMQIDNLHIEILPKIDRATPTYPGGVEGQYQKSRQNLLYMLSMAGKLPLHERDLASQKIRRLPLWEALILTFARKLLVELRRGQPHAYVYREEDLNCVRGRILIQQQLRQNATRRHMIRVGYDEFSNDTRLNRILKAGCVRLLEMTKFTESQQLLREALLELADVMDCIVDVHDFENLHIDRNAERFRDLLGFCRLVFLGTTPSPEVGQTASFSLLFPMEALFEEFVGGCLKRFAGFLGFERSRVHLQAAANRRWLLRDAAGHGRFRLKPDVVVSDDRGQPDTILDTKWKHLVSDDVDSKNGVDQRDMYQLYAYATRYRCFNNILLFPKVAGVSSKSYCIDGDSPPVRLRIEFLDLAYDLRSQRSRLIDDFKRILAQQR